MKRYRIVKCRIGTLERVQTWEITAESAEAARKEGESKYGEAGYFIGAESID